MRYALLFVMAACGRIGFDAPAGADAPITSDTATPDAAPDIARGGLALDIFPGDVASYSGTGTLVRDLSPFGNDATIMGGVTFVAAGAGSYFQFDGSDAQFLTLGSPTPSGWKFARDPRTLSSWAWLTTNRPGYSQIFGYGTGTDGEGNYLGTSDDGTGWNFGGFYINQYGGTATTGDWVNLTGVWDGTTASLYVNGVLSTQSAQPMWNAIAGGVPKIGIDTNFANEGWQGNIGRLLYYQRALSADEVAQNYAVMRVVYP